MITLAPEISSRYPVQFRVGGNVVSGQFLNFAYGSNMCSQRLQNRCPSASPVGVGALPGYKLTFHKSSTDGSGKCDIEPTGNPDDCIWGVVFSIEENERTALDQAEGLGYGYEAVSLTVQVAGKPITVHAYVAAADARNPSLAPYHWYKNFVVKGATEHNLPATYVEFLTSVPSIDDPNKARAAANAAICS